MVSRDFVDWSSVLIRRSYHCILTLCQIEWQSVSSTDEFNRNCYYCLINCSQVPHFSTKLPQLLSCQTSNVLSKALLNMRSTPYVTSRTSLSFLSTVCWLCCQSRATLSFSLLFYARDPFNALRCFSYAASPPPTSSGQYWLLSASQSFLFLKTCAQKKPLQKNSSHAFFVSSPLSVV